MSKLGNLGRRPLRKKIGIVDVSNYATDDLSADIVEVLRECEEEVGKQIEQAGATSTWFGGTWFKRTG